jgi:glyoxylase I family protein
MLKELDHVNIVVSDLDRMLAFYGEILGLRQGHRGVIAGPWIDAVVRLHGVDAEFATLEALTPGPTLELLCYRHPTSERPADLAIPNSPGLRHLAFTVLDIDIAVERLTQSGVDFLSGVQVAPELGGSQKHMVYFRDPEGNLVELCERRPVVIEPRQPGSGCTPDGRE